jgi:3'-phosphoadenosine 5'-phosphosulfate sulfotransferase (PAPS reductase)/FAD synthetase
MMKDKKHAVSFSGGRTSAYLCYLMIEKYGKDSVDFIFTDTGAEHPKTYEFIKKCNKHFGLDLICLRPLYSSEKGVGVSYEVVNIDDIGWDLTSIKEQVEIYGNFTIDRPNCTSKIKSDTLDKFKKDNYLRSVYSWYGMRIDEPRRLKFLNPNKDLFSKKDPNPKNIKYLAEISNFDKQDVLNWWAKMPFDLEIPEHLGNCVFCIKKSPKKIALAQRDEPALFDEWNEAVTGNHVRLMPGDKFGIGRIYRNWLTPKNLIGLFSGVDYEDLKDSVYRGKKTDIGECSESCEAFGQLDIFNND